MEKRLTPGALPQTPRLAAGLFFISFSPCFSPREGEGEEERRSSEREKREGEGGKEKEKRRSREGEERRRTFDPGDWAQPDLGFEPTWSN